MQRGNKYLWECIMKCFGPYIEKNLCDTIAHDDFAGIAPQKNCLVDIMLLQVSVCWFLSFFILLPHFSTPLDSQFLFLLCILFLTVFYPLSFLQPVLSNLLCPALHDILQIVIFQYMNICENKGIILTFMERKVWKMLLFSKNCMSSGKSPFFAKHVIYFPLHFKV